MATSRIDYDKRVIRMMIEIYCHRKHHIKQRVLCHDCDELLTYAISRIEHCPKGKGKSSCRKCEIHCYSPQMRERLRDVMRYVGPRMLLIHPIEAIRHLYHELH